MYSGGGDRFWGIEYFEDDKWINSAYESGGGFQLTGEDIGEDCYIAYYERIPPSELESQSSISSQWDQKICSFGTEGPNESRIVRYIESGKYRLIFYYGFEIFENDLFQILKPIKVYSNTFSIN